MAKIEVQRTHIVEDPVVEVSVNLADGKIWARYTFSCPKCSGHGCRGGCNNSFGLSSIDEVKKHVGEKPYEALRLALKKALAL